VTVQVVGTNKSALVNREGHFQLLLPRGRNQIKFSHVGYLSTTIEVEADENTGSCDAYLQPTVLQVSGITAYDVELDPAQKIIMEAIRRKKDILARIHDYHFNAYTKLVVRENPKPDSTKIWLITETQVTCFWEQPDKYKEIITARKQSSNLPPEGNMVGVGEILNFNRNRIDAGSYSIVSPTAKDALDHYNYYLKDSLYLDGRKLYRLEIEPKSDYEPLFVGTICIADSTYDVAEVDVFFNEAVEIPFLDSLRYRQRFAQLENEYWMPIEIALSARVEIKFPGIPPRMSFEHHASLYDFSFDTGTPKGTFGEYEKEVAEKADDYDSTSWYSHQTIPLTTEEVHGYQVIDSLEKRPTPVHKTLLLAGATAAFLAVGGNYDMFHFNRVEGPYLGMRLNLTRLLPETQFSLKGGYGFDEKHGQFLVGVNHRLWKKRKLFVGGEYQQLIVNRPVQPDAWTNPTIDVLTSRRDPYDYFLQQGFQLYASIKVVNHTTLSLSYSDFQQSSVSVNTDFALFDENGHHRSNPHIEDGRARSLSAEVSFDSRKLANLKGKDQVSPAVTYTLLRLGLENSSPGLLGSDFDYRKYYISAYTRQRLGGWGMTSVVAYGGVSEKHLPRQGLFQIVSGAATLSGRGGFYTVPEQGFVGDRTASLFVNHDFGHRLLRGSGIPLIKEIPFTLSVHGGVFWTDFHNTPVSESYRFASTPYGEIGFGIGNLTPFLSVFNFQIRFSWQLSRHAGDRFLMSWGLGF